MIGLLILLVAVVVALLAPWIAPQNPYDLMQIDIMDNLLPPGGELMSGQVARLGTDSQGRDMLSGKCWIAVFPGAMVVIVIIAINLVGDRLRIVLTPRLSS